MMLLFKIKRQIESYPRAEFKRSKRVIDCQLEREDCVGKVVKA